MTEEQLDQIRAEWGAVSRYWQAPEVTVLGTFPALEACVVGADATGAPRFLGRVNDRFVTLALAEGSVMTSFGPFGAIRVSIEDTISDVFTSQMHDGALTHERTWQFSHTDWEVTVRTYRKNATIPPAAYGAIDGGWRNARTEESCRVLAGLVSEAVPT